jgi:membrane protease YdiL (CAAX protease family)
MSPILAYGLTLAISVANDLLLGLTAERYALYFADYAVKLVMLALLLVAGVHQLADPRPKVRPRPAVFVLWFVFAVVVHLSVVFIVARLERIWPLPHLFAWPRLGNSWLMAVDLTFGIALSVVVEELMARRLAWNVLQPHFAHTWGPLVVSSLFFSLGHWGRGPWNMMSATLVGATLFIAYRRTGSLALVIAAHYLVNFLVFARWYGLVWYDPTFYFR